MALNNDIGTTKNTNSLLTRALTQRRTGFSPDVLVADEVRPQDLVDSAPSSSSLAATNVVRNSLVAGSVSGMASTIVLYPMDFLRTNMQAAGMPSLQTSNGGLASSPTGGGGPLQILRQTLQTGGIRALYTGISLPLMAQAVYKGTVFTVNNILEHAVLDFKSMTNRNETCELNTMDRLFCGFTAGAINGGLFVTPVEYVRNQLIAEQARLSISSPAAAQTKKAVATSLNVIRQAIHVNGVHTLWRGVGITMVRDGVGVASFFATLAFTQNLLMTTYQTDQDKDPSFVIRVLSGGMGGLAYWISALPLDTVKTWIQSADPLVRVSPFQAIRQLYGESGLLAVVSRLNRGWQVAYGRGIPSSAITINVYSYVYQAMVQYDKKDQL